MTSPSFQTPKTPITKTPNQKTLLSSNKTPSSSTKSKNYLSLTEKMKIIKMFEDGASKAKIAREKSIPYTSVRAICERKEKIKEQATLTNPTNSKNIYMDRPRPMEKMEKLGPSINDVGIFLAVFYEPLPHVRILTLH